MKNHLKKIGIILMCMSLIWVVGCGKEKNQEVAMGRYIEQNIEIGDLPEMAQQFMVQRSDGKLQAFTIPERDLQAYIQQEDLTFKSVEVPGLDAVNKMLQERNGYIVTMNMDKEDSIYMVVVAQEEGYEDAVGDITHTRTYILQLKNGEMVMTKLNIEEELPYIMPNKIAILENGECILGGNYAGLRQFNLETGNSVRTYSQEEDGSFTVKDNKLYVASTLNAEMDIYDLASGQLEKNMPQDSIDENTYILHSNQGIYLVNHEGIWHLAENGDIWEELMEGTGVSIGLSSYYLQGAFYQNEQFVVALMDNEGRNKIKSYRYSSTTPSKPEIELTAYMLEDNQTFREAAVNYQLAHPKVRINVQQGLNDEGGITREDAIKALHTELLAGGGPDILLLDGLDRENYVEKNLLVNLDELEGIEGLLSQIRNAFKDESGTYGIPLRFVAPCLVADEALLKEVEDIDGLIDYQKAHMDTPVLMNMEASALYSSIAMLESEKWLDSEGTLNHKAMSQFLQGIKTLTDIYSGSQEKALEEDNDLQEAFKVAYGETKAGIWNITNIWHLLYASDVTHRRGNASLKIVKQEGKGCFEPVAVVGINQNSKEVELAKDIVSSMLSEENQKVDMDEGFPTQQATLEKWLKGETINHTTIMGAGNEEGQELSAYWENKSLIPVFEEELKGLAIPVMPNYHLEEMVLEEAQPYWRGEKSLEEVLKKIETRIALYNEG